jgi:hypothetical protein
MDEVTQPRHASRLVATQDTQPQTATFRATASDGLLPIDVVITCGVPRTPEYDALWRWLLRRVLPPITPLSALQPPAPLEPATARCALRAEGEAAE